MRFTRIIDIDELKNNWAAILSQLASRNEVVIVESEGRKFRLEPINQTEQQATDQATGPQLTDAEVTAALKVLESAHQLTQKMSQRRGGKPLADSWPDIRKDREERSNKWL